jgi:ElaB/YqjD/DUF883 family membrane-anchored ribosome-binding protein
MSRADDLLGLTASCCKLETARADKAEGELERSAETVRYQLSRARELIQDKKEAEARLRKLADEVRSYVGGGPFMDCLRDEANRLSPPATTPTEELLKVAKAMAVYGVQFTATRVALGKAIKRVEEEI